MLLDSVKLLHNGKICRHQKVSSKAYSQLGSPICSSFSLFSSCPDAAARPANVSSRKSRCISPLHSQSFCSPPSFTRANAPRHADTLTAHPVEGNHSAARMLLASKSTAQNKSQGIPIPEPGSAQQETHFHHHGGSFSAATACPHANPCSNFRAVLWFGAGQSFGKC